MTKKLSKSIEIVGALNQQKLRDALKSIIPAEDWLDNGVNVPIAAPVRGKRYHWDIGFVRGQETYVVAFDDDTHYRDVMVMKADDDMNRLAKDEGLQIIRIPYWVQLDTETFKFLFKFGMKVKNDYPHGFYDGMAPPASFCPMGLARYEAEMAILPDAVEEDVLQSLDALSEKNGAEFVVPLTWLQSSDTVESLTMVNLVTTALISYQYRAFNKDPKPSVVEAIAAADQQAALIAIRTILEIPAAATSAMDAIFKNWVVKDMMAHRNLESVISVIEELQALTGDDEDDEEELH